MPSTLERLMAHAVQDSRHEQAFFQALLKAIVYAHMPASDRLDGERIRFVQFHRPDNGALVLPFFTDEKKARRALGTSERVIALSGRRLLELTRGATLMLNPNDNRCVLYPEEIDTFLRTGFIANLTKFTVEEGKSPLIGPPTNEPPSWMIDALITALAKLTYVQVAYIIGVYTTSESPQQTGFLIALGGDGQYAERAVHAVTTVLQPLCQEHDGPGVDMTHFEHPAGQVPDWVSTFSLEPFYDRTWGARLNTGPYHATGPNA
jgi:hypothetical protein